MCPQKFYPSSFDRFYYTYNPTPPGWLMLPITAGIGGFPQAYENAKKRVSDLGGIVVTITEWLPHPSSKNRYYARVFYIMAQVKAGDKKE